MVCKKSAKYGDAFSKSSSIFLKIAQCQDRNLQASRIAKYDVLNLKYLIQILAELFHSVLNDVKSCIGLDVNYFPFKR